MNAEPDARDELQDAQLARWYREGGGPEPAPALDQAILAAAHREVHARPRAADSPLRRWRVPLALAAVVVLSVTVVTLVREETGELAGMGAPPVASPAAQAPAASEAAREQTPGGEPAESTGQQLAVPDAPAKRAPKAAAAPPVPPASAPPAVQPAPLGQSTEPASPLKDMGRKSAPVGPAPAEPFPWVAKTPPAATTGSASATAPRAEPPAAAADAGEREDARRTAGARDDGAKVEEASRQPEARERAAAAPGVVAPAAKPAPAPLASPSGALRQERAPAESHSMARLRAQPPAPSSPEVAQLLKTLDDQPPERWLEKIEELRRAGRNAESEELLAAFRKRFPEHPGPAAR